MPPALRVTAVATRQQAAMSDRPAVRQGVIQMIPPEFWMSEQASHATRELRNLATIIADEQAEIEQMKAKLRQLDEEALRRDQALTSQAEMT